jgi:hypothetical protein
MGLTTAHYRHAPYQDGHVTFMLRTLTHRPTHPLTPGVFYPASVCHPPFAYGFVPNFLISSILLKSELFTHIQSNMGDLVIQPVTRDPSLPTYRQVISKPLTPTVTPPAAAPKKKRKIKMKSFKNMPDSADEEGEDSNEVRELILLCWPSY